MKKTLFLLVGLLFSLASLAQQVVQLPDLKPYRGNDYYTELILSRADSALRSSVLLYVRQSGPLVETVNQPFISRSGRKLGISWSRVQTLTLPDPRAWIVIKAGDAIRYQGWVVPGNKPGGTLPNEPTTPVATAPSLSSKPYRVANVPNTGYFIQHDKANRLVTGTFFREDTGQIDQLWRIIILNDNAVQVTGPPNETFSGTIVLSFIPQLSN